MTRSLRRRMRLWLRRTGYEVSRADQLEPYLLDQEVLLVSLLDPARLQVIRETLRYTVNVPGSVAEAGVYRGGVAMLLRRDAAPEKHLYLLDTFRGLPDPAAVDLHAQGDFADTTLDAVRERVGDKLVTYLPGLFADRFADIKDETFSFVHVDGDLYESTRECIEFFAPRMARGGVIVFDDASRRSCPGVLQAIRETNTPVILLPTGQALFVKH